MRRGHGTQCPLAEEAIACTITVCTHTLMYIMLSTLTARNSRNSGASCSRTALRNADIESPLRTDTCVRVEVPPHAVSRSRHRTAPDNAHHPHRRQAARHLCTYSHLAAVSTAIPVGVDNLKRFVLHRLLLRKPFLCGISISQSALIQGGVTYMCLRANSQAMQWPPVAAVCAVLQDSTLQRGGGAPA
jgi:hypothetical protein